MPTPPPSSTPSLAQVLAPPPLPGTVSTIEPVYTGIAGACQRLGISRSTARRLIAAGDLPATRLPTGTIRIRIADLDALGEPVADPAPATVTVTAAGLTGGSWAVTIDGEALSGYGAESRAAAEAELWTVPERGGTVTIDGVSIRVPHRAAGQAASITLAGLAGSFDGGAVTVRVAADADPVEAVR